MLYGENGYILAFLILIVYSLFVDLLLSEKKRVVVVVILSLLVLIFFWIALYVFPSGGVDAEIKDGVLDISKIDITNYNSLNLSGDWLFYNNQFIVSDRTIFKSIKDVSILKVPSAWKGQELSNGSVMEGRGFGTYQLTLYLIPGLSYLFSVPDISSSYSLYINGEQFSANGKISKKLPDIIPEKRYEVFIYKPKQSKNVIQIEVANYHYRTGGMWHPIKIGGEEQMFRRWIRTVGHREQVVGIGFSLSFLLILFYIVSFRSRSWLYLAAFLFFGIIRSLVTEELIINSYIRLSYNIMVFIEFGATMMCMLFLVAYFKSIFEDSLSRYVGLVLMICFFLYFVFILATPVYIYSSTIRIFQAFIVFAGFYSLVFSIINLIKGSENGWLILISASFLVFALINDVLIKVGLISGEDYDNMVYLGAEVVVMIQMVILYIRLQEKYLRSEDVARDLEKAVKSRTIDLEDANSKLHELAMKDQLTSLFSRQKFDHDRLVLDEFFRVSPYTDNYKISILYLDLDNFKYYNDTFGHPVGDQILIQFGRLLQNLLRGADSVYRIGGDEFVIFLPDTDEEGAKRMALRILDKFEIEDYFRGQLEIYLKKKLSIDIKNQLSCSIGIASFYGDSGGLLDTNNIVINADRAMLSAKSGGKNCFVVYSKEMDSYDELMADRNRGNNYNKK